MYRLLILTYQQLSEFLGCQVVRMGNKHYICTTQKDSSGGLLQSGGIPNIVVV